MPSIGDITARLSLDTSGFTRAAQDVAAQASRMKAGLESLNEPGGRLATTLGKLKDVGTQLTSSPLFRLGGAVGIAVTLVQMGRAAADAALSFEKINNTLKAATGSAQEATNAYAHVLAKSRELGLDVAETAQAFARLTAAARGTALAGEGATRIFDAVMMASRALGLSTSETGGALNALQQMISKGTVQAEELRGQLGERLPGAFQLAARAMGVTTQELGKMLELGQVAAEDLLPKLASELEKTYGKASQEAAQGFGASLARLKTEFFELNRVVGEYLAGPATGFANWITGMFAAIRGPSTVGEMVAELRRLEGKGFTGEFYENQRKALRERLATMEPSPEARMLFPTPTAAPLAKGAQEALTDLGQTMARIQSLSGIYAQLGQTYDATTAKTKALLEATTKLLDAGLKPSSPEVQKLVAELRALQGVSKPVYDGILSLSEAVREAAERNLPQYVEGLQKLEASYRELTHAAGSFEGSLTATSDELYLADIAGRRFRETLEAQAEALRQESGWLQENAELVRQLAQEYEGWYSTADEVQRATERNATALKRFAEVAPEKNWLVDVFDSATYAMDKMVEGVLLGTRTLKSAFRDLASSIVVDFARRVISDALAPVRAWLVGLASGTAPSAGAATAAGGGLAGGMLSMAGGLSPALGFAPILGSAASGLTGQSSYGVLGGALGMVGGAAGLARLLGPAMMSGLPMGELMTNIGALLATPSGMAGIASLAGAGLSMAGAMTGNRALTIAGGALSGAGMGFMVGNFFAPGIGGLIGAGVGAIGGGLLSGLFGGSRNYQAERRAERQEQSGDIFNAILDDLERARTPAELQAVLAKPLGGSRVGDVLSYMASYDKTMSNDLMWRKNPSASALLGSMGFAPAPYNTEFGGRINSIQELIGVTGSGTGSKPEQGIEAWSAMLKDLVDASAGLREFESALTAFMRGLDMEIMMLNASTQGTAAQAVAMRQVIATSVASSQQALDAAHAALLTLADPADIAEQGEKIHALIQQRYQDELRLVQQFVGQLQALADTWRVVGAGIGDTVEALRLSALGPTSPRQAFGITQGAYISALTAFQGAPSPELAQAVLGAAQPYLMAAAGLFARPSAEYQTIFRSVIDSLAGVEQYAQDQADTLESQIADFLGEGVTLQSLIEQNTAAMAASLDGLRADLQLLLGGTGLLPEAAVTTATPAMVAAGLGVGGGSSVVLEAGAVVVNGAGEPEAVAEAVVKRVAAAARYGRLRYAVTPPTKG